MPAQIMRTSWHNMCSFITTYELHRLSCIGQAFGLVYTVQKALNETGATDWLSFNNRKDFRTSIKKKSKLKTGNNIPLYAPHVGMGRPS